MTTPQAYALEVDSRSRLRRIAAQKGEPAPTFGADLPALIRELNELLIKVAACEGPKWDALPEQQREAISKRDCYEFGHAAAVLTIVQMLRSAYPRLRAELQMCKERIEQLQVENQALRDLSVSMAAERIIGAVGSPENVTDMSRNP